MTYTKDILTYIEKKAKRYKCHLRTEDIFTYIDIDIDNDILRKRQKDKSVICAPRIY